MFSGIYAQYRLTYGDCCCCQKTNRFIKLKNNNSDAK